MSPTVLMSVPVIISRVQGSQQMDQGFGLVAKVAVTTECRDDWTFVSFKRHQGLREK